MELESEIFGLPTPGPAPLVSPGQAAVRSGPDEEPVCEEDSGDLGKGDVICISEVIDISPGNLDSSLCF